jgi:PAS domain S-box-containing protein
MARKADERKVRARLTKAQLIEQNDALRRRIAELEHQDKTVSQKPANRAPHIDSPDSHARYGALLDSASQGILIHEKFKPLYANQALADMYGYDTPDDILALKSALDLRAPSHCKQPRNYDARMRGEPVPIDRISLEVRKDGTEFWVNRRAFVIEWNGKSVVCSLRSDITEHRQVQERLRAEETRFRTLIDGANQGILVHRHYKPLYANQALADIYGYASPEEILALPSVRELRPPELRKTELFHEALLRGEDVPLDRELKGLRKDGSEIWLNSAPSSSTGKASPQSAIFASTLPRANDPRRRCARPMTRSSDGSRNARMR